MSKTNIGPDHKERIKQVNTVHFSWWQMLLKEKLEDSKEGCARGQGGDFRKQGQGRASLQKTFPLRQMV